jgi:hypothetical protein
MDNNYRLSHLPVQNTKVIVMNRVMVSPENLQEVKGLTALDHHDQIELEDVISVVFFHNATYDCSGTVTIWHNRNRALVKTPSTSQVGEWVEPLKLVVFEEQEEGWTMDGELVIGNLAMDLHGEQGIYACGEFYRNRQVPLRETAVSR